MLLARGVRTTNELKMYKYRYAQCKYTTSTLKKSGSWSARDRYFGEEVQETSYNARRFAFVNDQNALVIIREDRKDPTFDRKLLSICVSLAKQIQAFFYLVLASSMGGFLQSREMRVVICII